MTWHEYKVSKLPADFLVDGKVVPLPVIVKFDSGREEEDWISGGELMMYCDKSCPPEMGHPVAWRYKYSKAEFLRLVEEQRRRRQ